MEHSRFSFHFSWDCGGYNEPENPVPYSNGFIVGGSVSETCPYDSSSNEHVTVKVNASNLVSWEVYETELLGKYFYSKIYCFRPLNAVK